MYLAGMLPLTFVRLFEALLVAKTLPLSRPTRRTESFCGEIEMLLIGEPTLGSLPVGSSGLWLTMSCSYDFDPFREQVGSEPTGSSQQGKT